MIYFNMHRVTTMALGFFLIFFGAQLNIVERYVMTQRTANFVSPDGATVLAVEPQVANGDAVYNSPYYQASYQVPKTSNYISPASREIHPPRWLCWPVLFLGAVVLLHGATMHRG